MSEYTEKQAIWTRNYINSMGEIKIRPSKEDKVRYQEAAKQSGMSLNQFIILTIEEKIKGSS